MAELLNRSQDAMVAILKACYRMRYEGWGYHASGYNGSYTEFEIVEDGHSTWVSWDTVSGIASGQGTGPQVILHNRELAVPIYDRLLSGIVPHCAETEPPLTGWSGGIESQDAMDKYVGRG